MHQHGWNTLIQQSDDIFPSLREHIQAKYGNSFRFYDIIAHPEMKAEQKKRKRSESSSSSDGDE
jgi:hypothetical protein